MFGIRVFRIAVFVSCLLAQFRRLPGHGSLFRGKPKLSTDFSPRAGYLNDAFFFYGWTLMLLCSLQIAHLYFSPLKETFGPPRQNLS